MKAFNNFLKISFSQNTEDVFAEYFLKDVKKGFYVDVGASDPTVDSVTKNFYGRGWDGINIEPIKRYHEKLLKLRPRDINLNIGISMENGSAIFREYKSSQGLSTMASDTLDLYNKRNEDSNFKNYVERKVVVRTLQSVFDEYKVSQIHFMKVDVEGFEYEVLRGNNWDKYRPELICIGRNLVINDWRPLLKSAGYSPAFSDGLNDYYVAKESKMRASGFSYADTALPTQILSYPTVEAVNVFIAKTKAEKNALMYKNSELIFNNEELERKLMTALDKLESLTGLKNLARTFAYILNQKIENKIYPIESREIVHITKTIPIPIVDDIAKQAKLVNKYDSQYMPNLILEADHFRRKLLKFYRLIIRGAVYCYKYSIRGLRKVKRLLRGKK